MGRNMGKADRVIRGSVVVPAGLIVAYLAGFGTVLGVVALVIAGIMLVTALAGSCPIYRLLGISCPVRPAPNQS